MKTYACNDCDFIGTKQQLGGHRSRHHRENATPNKQRSDKIIRPVKEKKIRSFDELGPRKKKEFLVDECGGVCVICRQATHNDLPIPLELDHINGNSDDNSRENLRVLCPICHSRTPTFRGRNIRKGRGAERRKFFLRSAYNTLLKMTKEEIEQLSVPYVNG